MHGSLLLALLAASATTSMSLPRQAASDGGLDAMLQGASEPVASGKSCKILKVCKTLRKQGHLECCEETGSTPEYTQAECVWLLAQCNNCFEECGC